MVGTKNGYQYLALAVIEKAMIDARSRDDHTRLWAKGWLLAEGPTMLDLCGLDYRLTDFYKTVLKGSEKHERGT